ncbi:condensation domain-containing protein [Streptomyces sp. NPDC053431]|uniref:condensation domain-containing protein n=1 Tax=Streptomyces sp. NPDC053431 TaxID=3365703 RepID=UPI0037D33536
MPGSSCATPSAAGPSGGLDAEGSTVGPTSRTLPLTATQRKIWLADQGASGPHEAYRISQCVEIHGPVDTRLFEAAMRQVLTEADTLRVRVAETSDGPVQEVRPAAGGALVSVDVSGEPEPRDAARGWIAADMAVPFDLARGPLFRCALITLRQDHWLCYLSAHHVVADGFSLFLITRRFTQVYTLLAAGERVGASPFGSLADLVKADGDYRSSARYAADRAYWTRTFGDPPDPAPVPARPAFAQGQEDGAERDVGSGYLSARAVCASGERPLARPEALQEAARLAGIGRSRFLCAAAAVYVHQLTRAPEVVIGLAVTGRPQRDLMSTPGVLHNIVPLRLGVRSPMPLAELLTQVDRAMLEAVDHQRYPGEDLARDLGLPGSIASRFSLIVNIMPFGRPLSLAGHPCTVSDIQVAAGRPAGLKLLALDRRDGAGLRLDVQAPREHYSRADVTAHQERLLILLGAMTTAAPDRQVGTFTLPSPGERTRLPHADAGSRPRP